MAFKEGHVALKNLKQTDAQLAAYASSLLSNRLKKDTRLGAVPVLETGEPDQPIDPEVTSAPLALVADVKPSYVSDDQGNWFATHGEVTIPMASR